MEKKTEGAWLIHQSKKIQSYEDAQDFEDIEFSGKCGVFLSNLAASDEQSELNADKVDAIRKVSKIKKGEVDSVKKKLEDLNLIENAKNGSIAVLGITTSTVLTHTSDIFNSTKPSSFQKAVIDLSDNISDLPKEEKELHEYIGDKHKLAIDETKDLFLQAENIGLVDFEKLDNDSKLYFNGNLFKQRVTEKTRAVLSSLKPDESQRISTLDALLTKAGCATFEEAKRILTEPLLAKLQAIGMYDFNEVSNPNETKVFVTKPAAFSKFGNPFEDDALDLAKAFVSALYYGMNFSSAGRGKITMLGALMRRLVNGHMVGPANAIGEDYKILELNRVIEVRSEGSRYYMRLLKKDIGELALQVLQLGDSAEYTVVNSTMYSGSVTGYNGPENNRQYMRKKQLEPTKKQVANLLRTFRG